jgi:hypothetical protein
MIEEIKLNGFANKPIKTTKKPPPRSINENLPPCYFTSIFIGSNGSGKAIN